MSNANNFYGIKDNNGKNPKKSSRYMGYWGYAFL